MTWLDDVYDLVWRGKPRAALDVLFDQVDDLLCAEDYAAVDHLLQSIDVLRLDSNLIVGVLSITLRAAPHLPHRPIFRELSRIQLQQLAPDRAHRLMENL